MNDFLNNLSSLGWWLGVVIVGLLINLVAAYLEPRFGIFMTRTSTWWAKRSAPQRTARDKRINRLRSSEHEQVLVGIRLIRYLLMSVQTFLFAIMFVLVHLVGYSVVSESEATWMSDLLLHQVPLFLSALCMMFSLMLSSDSFRVRVELREAQSQESASALL